MNNDLEELRQEFALVLGGLSSNETQLRSPVRPKGWSIQQIAEHLLLTYNATERAVDTRLVKGTPTMAKPSLAQHIGRYFLVGLGYFPRGRKSPEAVMPPESGHRLSGEELTQSAEEHLARLDALFDAAEQKFGSKKAISHMVLGPMTVAEWRRFHLIHGRHHMDQVRKICREHDVQGQGKRVES